MASLPARRRGLRWFLREIWILRDSAIIVGTPVVLLPLILVNPSMESKCAYGVLLMLVLWLTGALPLPMTALLPVVVFPLLNVQKAGILSRLYLKEDTLFLVGVLILALSIERWNLHRRVALRLLLLVGYKPLWLLSVFMLISGVLSVWISNSATCTMMITIAKAVVDEISRDTAKEDENTRLKAEVETPTLRREIEESEENESVSTYSDKIYRDKSERVRKALTLGILYSSTFGGMATLRWTSAKADLKEEVNMLFGSDAGINFSTWITFSLPVAAVCLIIAWAWLQVYCFGVRQTFTICRKMDEDTKRRSRAFKPLIHNEYQKLGPMSFAEWILTFLILILIILLLTRQSELFTGWVSLFKLQVPDAVPALLVAFSLFVLPSTRPNFFCFRSASDLSPLGPKPPLMVWSFVRQSFPWEIIPLLGGGLALASTCQKSGLAAFLAQRLSVLRYTRLWVSSIVTGGVVALVTEMTRSSTITSAFVPVMAEMGVSMGLNPVGFIMIAMLSSSFAFILPASASSNTIALTYGNLEIKDMLIPGLVLKFLCLVVLVILFNTWGQSHLELHKFSAWADHYRGPMGVETIIVTSQNCTG